jgi:hypothetical protein
VADGANGSLHELARSSVRSSWHAVVKLRISGSGLRRVDTRRHEGQVAGPECSIGSVRSKHRHIGHAVAEMKAAHAAAELDPVARL